MKNFRPMLAGKVDDIERLRYPVLVSPKLDGVRCTIINGVAMSRSLKPIPNLYVQKQLRHKKFELLDGELVVGPATDKRVFTTTTSGVMAIDGKPDFCFNVFDKVLTDFRFSTRLDTVYRQLGDGAGSAALVKHRFVESAEQLLKVEEEFVSLGYEGLMVRDPLGPYKFGRSTAKEGWLLKLKRFEDDEAVVVAVEPLYHNENEAVTNELGYKERSTKKAGKVQRDTMGALVCLTPAGVEFRIGTGFTEAQRKELWLTRKKLVGSLVKYKHQPAGAKDRPRLPVFLGLRDEKDL